MFQTVVQFLDLLRAPLRRLRVPLLALGIFSSLGIGANDADPGQVTISVARMFESLHYSALRFDEALGEKILRSYLESLDYNHFFFTQEDVNRCEAEWAHKLHEEILNGRTLFPHQIHDLFRQRASERIRYARQLLEEGLDLDTHRFVEINRQKSPWPINEPDARQLWRDRVTSELLQERLSRKKSESSAQSQPPADPGDTSSPKLPQKTALQTLSKKNNLLSKSAPSPSKGDPLKTRELSPAQAVLKRYEQFLKNLQEETPEEVLRNFLQCVALSYDPHSDYLNQTDLEQFGINMRLSLFGIGAKLRSDDGYARIIELVPGGPALKCGKIRVGDRILGVAQGTQEFVDCVDLKLDKVVGMIRGKKDSIVRLQILPLSAADPTDWSVVELRRDEVKLKDEEARAELIEWTKPNGQTVKLGWIVLPSFYGDPDRSTNPSAKSTTRDVLALLQRLKKEGIQGLVMDLRRNPGGYLDEAVSLSGLFIRKGPIVQVKNRNGEINVLRDKDSKIEYDGPLVVLINRHSASASEIFSAAMQDYRRAVIVGDSRTFGKGTVQQIIELNRSIPVFSASSSDAGAVKLTIQKFYRVAGGSTQFRGVESDIVLPSIFDQPDTGESSLKYPLRYDTINSLDFEKWDKPLHLSELRRRSNARVPGNIEFQYAMEDLERIRTRMAQNQLSINETIRRNEIEEEQTRKHVRELERESAPKAKDPIAFRVPFESNRKELAPIRFIDPKSSTSAGDKNEKSGRPLNSTFEIEELPPEGVLEAFTEKDGKLAFRTSPYRLDPVKTETFQILTDLIELGKVETTAPNRRR